MLPPSRTSSSIVCAMPAFSSSPSGDMPPLPERRAASARRRSARRRLGASSVPCQRVTSITRLWPALAAAPRLAGADRQRPVLRGRASSSSSVDGLRVEPAFDAGRQRARAVGVQGEVGDRLRARARRRTRRPPSAARRPASPAPTPASSCAFARIFSVALAIAAGTPSDGLVLNPWPVPKRFSSAGTTLTSSAGTPSSAATSWA